MRIALLALTLATADAAAESSMWRFEARFEQETNTLEVRACSDRSFRHLRFRGARDALRAAVRSSGAELQAGIGTLDALDWSAGECLLTRIDATAAARADRRGRGHRPEHYWLLPPNRWLWRPGDLNPDSTIHFKLPAGWAVSAPWQPIPDGGYRLGGAPQRWPAQIAIGRFSERRVQLPGGVLRISVLPTAEDIDEKSIVTWLGEIATQLTLLGGELPRADTQVLVYPLPGVSSAVPWGEVTRGGGSAVHLHIGLDAMPAQRRADWTASHEFAHLLHPFLGDSGRWLSEGLASYYQNVLRARSGELNAETAWMKLRKGFDRGRESAADDPRPLQQVAAGRVRSATMRVYWAGAAFWLETDRALRKHGDSLDALLVRFARRHGDSTCCWTPETFMRALHALAPEAELVLRHSRYAASRGFPLDSALLDDWEQELARPGAQLPRILARHPSAEADRSHSR